MTTTAPALRSPWAACLSIALVGFGCASVPPNAPHNRDASAALVVMRIAPAVSPYKDYLVADLRAAGELVQDGDDVRSAVEAEGIGSTYEWHFNLPPYPGDPNYGRAVCNVGRKLGVARVLLLDGSGAGAVVHYSKIAASGGEQLEAIWNAQRPPGFHYGHITSISSTLALHVEVVDTTTCGEVARFDAQGRASRDEPGANVDAVVTAVDEDAHRKLRDDLRSAVQRYAAAPQRHPR